MMIDVTAAAQQLKAQDNILILIHQFPDGDTIGCGYALCRSLQRLGKHARIECNHTVNSRYDYFTKGIEIQQFEPDFIVAVDVADEKLLGEKLSKYCGKVDLCIDHHGSNTLYAKQSCVDATASAACEIVYEVAMQLCGEVDYESACALYTGIATDTGCFKFSNTTARTHMMASKLIEKGVPHSEINRVMFDTKSKSRVLVERMAMDSIIFANDDKCALMVISKDMRHKSGASDYDLDGITSLPRQIEGVIVGITIRERENNICKISVRTYEPISASDFCAVFGGGGHARAGGCEIAGSIDEVKARLLERADEMLKGCTV